MTPELIAFVLPVVCAAIGLWFDGIGPIDGLVERFLFSTGPMTVVGCLLGTATVVWA